jgi:hypothetical protein
MRRRKKEILSKLFQFLQTLIKIGKSDIKMIIFKISKKISTIQLVKVFLTLKMGKINYLEKQFAVYSTQAKRKIGNLYEERYLQDNLDLIKTDLEEEKRTFGNDLKILGQIISNQCMELKSFNNRFNFLSEAIHMMDRETDCIIKRYHYKAGNPEK